ncbi:MAG: hypothetical protein ACKOFX_11595, partial [Solirubrobacterales bacterium]
SSRKGVVMESVLRPSGLLFKRVVLVFWTMFFTMVAITNFVNLMGVFDVFDWTFLNSENIVQKTRTTLLNRRPDGRRTDSMTTPFLD